MLLKVTIYSLYAPESYYTFFFVNHIFCALGRFSSRSCVASHLVDFANISVRHTVTILGESGKYLCQNAWGTINFKNNTKLGDLVLP